MCSTSLRKTSMKSNFLCVSVRAGTIGRRIKRKLRKWKINKKKLKKKKHFFLIRKNAQHLQRQFSILLLRNSSIVMMMFCVFVCACICEQLFAKWLWVKEKKKVLPTVFKPTLKCAHFYCVFQTLKSKSLTRFSRLYM